MASLRDMGSGNPKDLTKKPNFNSWELGLGGIGPEPKIFSSEGRGVGCPPCPTPIFGNKTYN
jgi:hypothetical protein